MSDLKFTQDHEWIRLEGDGVATVGITDYAQEQLGDVVFVELPQIGEEVDQGEEAAVVESVKAAGEVRAPASGKVTEVNTLLSDEPQKVNAEPTGDGWFFKLRLDNPEELEALMDEAGYAEYIKGLD